MGIIQLALGHSDEPEMDQKVALEMYLENLQKAKLLMMSKNHDYDEAWRSMRLSSITDVMLMKIHRTKQIENNEGQTLISEGIDANYLDLINYAVFAMIKIEFGDK